jgi:hypothetical protein
MSKIGSTDGLSILARYTSVVAIAVASAGSLPKNVFEDVPRNDQNRDRTKRRPGREWGGEGVRK